MLAAHGVAHGGRYIERVIKETLRKWPIVCTMSRDLVEPEQVRVLPALLSEHARQVGDYTLPAGTQAILNPYAIHRNPEFWPDPLRFDPDRFMEVRESDKGVPLHGEPSRRRNAWVHVAHCDRCRVPARTCPSAWASACALATASPCWR